MRLTQMPAVTRISGAGILSFGANEAAAEITNSVMISRMTIVCVSDCNLDLLRSTS